MILIIIIIKIYNEKQSHEINPKLLCKKIVSSGAFKKYYIIISIRKFNKCPIFTILRYGTNISGKSNVLITV